MFSRALLVVAVFAALSSAAHAQPANDACADAAAVSDGVPLEFTSCDATVDGAATPACSAESVLSDFWLSYTFTVDGTATLYCGTLEGVGFAEVYAGTCGDPGAATACVAGAGAGQITFEGTVGATVLIRLGYTQPNCAGELLITTSSPGRALPTAFTYQGRVSDSGTPVNGLADLTFRLYDFYSGGIQVGPTLTKAGVSVADGYFTTLLDFGPGVCDGRDRWLEIDVNGSTLLPRQELTATPYALFAVKAGTATYADSAGYASSAGYAAVAGTATRADNGGRGGVLIENLTVETPTFTNHDFPFPNGGWVPIVQSQRTLTLPAGRATLNWSLSGFVNINSVNVLVRVVLAGQASPSQALFFEYVLDTKTVSGHAVFDIPAEITGVVGLEVRLPSSGKVFTVGSGTAMSWNLVVYKD
ncbi:MAG: hypothetical protein ACKVS8_10550 [Phycisphaerales bacterium]